MTRIERKLQNAGVASTEILRAGPRMVEVKGADRERTKELANTVCRVADWGGYMSGHGSWVFKRDWQ